MRKLNTFPLLIAALLAVVALCMPHEASSAFNPTPTGTGYRHVTSGKEDPASVATIPLAAGGTSANLSACSASNIPTVNAATNALECHSYVSDGSGANVPSTGLIRLTDVGTSNAIVGLSAGTDYNVISYNATSAGMTFGNPSQFAYVTAYGVSITSSAVPGTITDSLSGQASGLLTVQQSLSSNFTTTAATSTNLNLAFTVTAGEFWEFEFWGTTLNTSGGIKFQITAPATCTVEGWLDSVTTTAILLSRQRFTAINTLSGTATNTGVSIDAPTRIFGRLNAVAGGTFSIGVASVTAGQTSTVRAGSSLTARRTTPL